MKKRSNASLLLLGKIVSHELGIGIPGLSVRVGSSKPQKPATVVTNEDGGFHLILPQLEKGKSLSIEVHDIDAQLIAKAEAPAAKRGSPAEIEIRVNDKRLKSHLDCVASIKPSEGRLFPTAHLNHIYGAINLYGGTRKKYAFGGRIKPGLTCPFPELEDFDNILQDAWGLVQGDARAAARFQSALDTIATRVKMRKGLMTSIDFAGKREKELKSRKTREHTHTGAASGAVMIPMERMGLMLMAARHLGKQNKVRANRYMNLVYSQLLEYYRMAPVFRTCRNAMLGDAAAQGDVRRMIGIWGEDCQPRRPDFDPFRDFDPRDEPMDPEFEDMLHCLDQLALGFGFTEVQEYSIASLIPNDGCPGDMAVLTGQGFGTVPGTIHFVGATTNETVGATPISWSDTSIEFQIPEGATYGPVGVNFPYRQGAIRCGRATSTQHRDGSAAPTLYVGGKPRIDRITFSKSGDVFDPIAESVSPGSTVVVEYDCTPNTTRRLQRIRESQVDLQTGLFPPLQTLSQEDVEVTLGQSHFSHSLSSLNYTRSTMISCEIELSNRCGSTRSQTYFVVHRPATLQVRGMEVTQATQFFRAAEHITLVSEQKSDNSVPLIADKKTLVRVYFTTDQVSSFNEGKSFGVNVKLSGTKGGEPLSNGNTISPFNLSSLVAKADNSVTTQRGILTSSANFLLPKSWIKSSFAGAAAGVPLLLTLDANLSMGQSEPWVRDRFGPLHDRVLINGLMLNPTLNLKCVIVRVEYTGTGSGGGVGAAPSLEACINTMKGARDMLPAAQFEALLPPSESDQVITFSEDLTQATFPNQEAPDTWEHLKDRIDGMSWWAFGDDDAFWTGHLDPAIPGPVAGAGSTASGAIGVSVFKTGNPPTAAHELGHSFILPHADFNTEYPDYNGLGLGLPFIGEFGVNVGAINTSDLANLNSLVMNPTSLVGGVDFMNSSGSTGWTSPFTFQKSLELVFGPTVVPNFPTNSITRVTSAAHAEHFFVSGRLDRKKKACTLHPIFHLQSAAPRATRRTNVVDLEVIALDKDEDVLFRQPIPGCECTDQFALRVPHSTSICHLEVRKKDAVLCRASKKYESIDVGGLKLDLNKEHCKLTWNVRTQAKEYWSAVQVSCDDGKSWHTLKLLESEQSHEFDPRKLGGGPNCRLRVLASDGFNTARKETDSFALPMKPPQLIALNFAEGMELQAGVEHEFEVQPVYILGVPHQSELKWHVDDRDVGKGRALNLALKPGKHVIRVASEGFEESALNVTVVVKEKTGK